MREHKLKVVAVLYTICQDEEAFNDALEMTMKQLAIAYDLSVTQSRLLFKLLMAISD